MSEIATLQPNCVWQRFDEICQIPRPSKHEEKITKYLLDFAKQRNLRCRQDSVGNVFIDKPATKGFENVESVVLQAHVDMVPQKRSDSNHNFLTDPIEAYIDGNFVRAKGTTLGADDGIGVAMILAVLDSTTIEHGEIHALFTIDEETGMTGAFALKAGDISAKYLINLDTENENEITIGCAGGLDANFTFDLEYSELGEHTKVYTISLSGLTGGHSGFEIILNRANANKVLCEFLYAVMEKTDMRLISFNGGNMRNAIPREATAVISINYSFENVFHKMFERFVEEKQSQFYQTDPHFSCIAAETITDAKAISQEQTAGIIRAIVNCPNGAVKYENHNCKILNTSTNLSFVKTEGNTLTVGCLLRSIDSNNKHELANAQKAIFELYGAKASFNGEYPGWQPVWDSQLLTVVKQACADVFGTEPKVDIVHAGLECGIFADTFPTMEAVSFGPNIKGPHSPNEVVEIESVGKTWNVLITALKRIPNKKMELVFASNNRHKLEEITKIIGNNYSILNLKQAGCEGEIPETGKTLAENALQKAHWVYDKTGKNCFADDTGLEIDALDGAPGVYTARFAGDDCTPEDNIQKTLRLMKGMENRRACFKTVIACIIDGKEYLFNGEVEGEIATEKMGVGGFGYDPIFVPKGYTESFAQMPLEQKNAMSHRGRATAKFVEFLRKL